MDYDFTQFGNVTQCEGMAHINIEGILDKDNNDEIRDIVMDALAKTKYFFIDLVKVSAMDSSAVGMLMNLVQVVELMDGHVYLLSPSVNLLRTWKLMDVDATFVDHIYATLERALQHACPDPKKSLAELVKLAPGLRYAGKSATQTL